MSFIWYIHFCIINAENDARIKIMIFFEVEANCLEKFEEDIVSRKEKISKISTEFKHYNNDCKKAYYFLSSIKGKRIHAGIIVWKGEINPELLNFPWELAGMQVEGVNISEITSYKFGELLENAIEEGFVNSLRYDVSIRRKLSLFSRDYSKGVLSDEEYYSEDMVEASADIENLKKRAFESLWGEDLIQEYDRIFSAKKNNKFMGHPVHYLFSSDNFAERERQVKNLIAALHFNKRLSSRRFCNISVSGISYRDLRDIEDLYEYYEGGTIMLRYRHEARQEAGLCDISMEVVEKLIDLIKKNANKVLTIFCFPLTCVKEKNIFFSGLPELSILEFHDNAVDFEHSKAYLMRKIQNDSVKNQGSLLTRIEDGKTYRAEELDKIYDVWYGEYLRSDLYPEYAHCQKVGSEISGEEKHGSAYSKLMGMIGLNDAKKVILKAINYYKAQKMFSEFGFEKNRLSMHMVFTGNPGTAKTTVARLFASIMRENEILSSGHLVEVGRADIVGKYVGSTAPLVKSAFQKAKGGVLFIDEAYSLVDDRDGMYGDEAINTIVQEMENRREDTCVIFAGYPDKMQKFLDKNPGLRSRIAFHVPFANYTVDELVEITKYMGSDRGVVLSDDAVAKLRNVFAEASQSIDFGNGRFVRNMMDRVRMAQAERLIHTGFDQITHETVRTIVAEDIEDVACPKTEVRKIGFMAD